MTKAEMARILKKIEEHVTRAEGVIARDHSRREGDGHHMWAYHLGSLEQCVAFIREALNESKGPSSTQDERR